MEVRTVAVALHTPRVDVVRCVVEVRVGVPSREQEVVDGDLCVPSCDDRRILQAVGLCLGQRAVLVLGEPCSVVLIVSLLGVDVGGVDELLHLREHVLGGLAGLSQVNSLLQDGDGCLDGLSA